MREVEQRKAARLSRGVARSFRDVVLERAKGCCEVCSARVEPIIEVHHVKAVADGGGGSPDNLIALCPNCHRVVTQIRFSRGGNEGWLLGFEAWLNGCGLYSHEEIQLLAEVAYENVRLGTDDRWRGNA